MNVKHWLHQHSLKLLALRDTPNAIAGGVAIGVFFGFIPVVGLKTLCAMFVAWLTRSNILAAVIALGKWGRRSFLEDSRWRWAPALLIAILIVDLLNALTQQGDQ